jgi:hypothetical protein
MEKNNFQQLQQELELSMSPHQHNQIRKIEGGIFHSLRFFRFVGSVVDIYIPGFARTIVGTPSTLPVLGEDVTGRSDPASLSEGNWPESDPR